MEPKRQEAQEEAAERGLADLAPDPSPRHHAGEREERPGFHPLPSTITERASIPIDS